MLLLLVLLSAAPTANDGRLLFRAKDAWVLTDRNAREVKRLPSLGGLSAVDADVAPDGRTFVFTAWDDASRSQRLYRWVEGEKAPTPLGAPKGWHADPAVTADGKWVLFGHQPESGVYNPGFPTQLYRVGMDGKGMSALTTIRGCYMGAASRDGKDIVAVHANCKGQRTLDSLAVKDGQPAETKQLVDWESSYSEPRLSADGKRLLFTNIRGDYLELWVMELATGQKKRMYEGVRLGEKARPAWVANGPDILFQLRGYVLRLGKDGKVASALVLDKEAAP